MRPCSTTRIWSARRMVDSRWAMTKVVRPCISSASPLWIIASDSESSELVASSRMRMRGSASSARAIDKPLPLPAGELDAALADDRVVTFRKALGKLVHARRAAGELKLLLGRVGSRKHDVLANRSVEEKRFLQHHAQLRAISVQVHRREIDAVDQHLAARRACEMRRSG